MKSKSRKKKTKAHAKSHTRARLRMERSINPDPALSPGLEESYEQERVTEDAASALGEPEAIDSIIGRERASMEGDIEKPDSLDESATPEKDR